MVENVVFIWRQVSGTLQAVAFYLVISVTLVLLALAVFAGFGLLPWPQIALSFGGMPIPNAGMYVQLGLTTVMALICLFLPANDRMARLERSHRNFNLSMQDVKRAYELAHAHDRRGVFSLSSEFESMRQRMELMREHPDLAHLEPELLSLAAQMSHESRDLARTYSEERVARARGFLKGRQEEVDVMTERLKLARMTVDELRRWMQDVETEERNNHSQIRRLEADLRDILPTLGYDFDEGRDANVVSLPKPPAKTDGLH